MVDNMFKLFHRSQADLVQVVEILHYCILKYGH